MDLYSQTQLSLGTKSFKLQSLNWTQRIGSELKKKLNIEQAMLNKVIKFQVGGSSFKVKVTAISHGR